MMGAVVPGRPVESAWLLHSEDEDDCGFSRGQTHMEIMVCLKNQESQEVRREQAGRGESQAFKFYTNQF